jgi:hypothetical protein
MKLFKKKNISFKKNGPLYFYVLHPRYLLLYVERERRAKSLRSLRKSEKTQEEMTDSSS